jgi:hypothetical protein
MQKIKATVRPQKKIQAKTISVGSNISLSQIREIDISNVQDGAVLLYDGNTNQFKSTNKINNSNTTILGGGF